jgi:hypothetical protein
MQDRRHRQLQLRLHRAAKGVEWVGPDAGRKHATMQTELQRGLSNAHVGRDRKCSSCRFYGRTEPLLEHALSNLLKEGATL